MCILSQNAIVAAGHALNVLTTEQRDIITTAWHDPLAKPSPADIVRMSKVDPKVVDLAMAVLNFYSNATYAELQARRAEEDPLVLDLRAQLAAVKHELEVAHRYAELLDAKNGVLRTSMTHTENVARHVDSDFVEMRDALATQF